MRKQTSCPQAASAGLAIGFLLAVSAQAQVRITFDYTYDTTGFFADPLRRTVLESAASAYTSRLVDSLAPIIPAGGNTWRANLVRPDLGTSIALQDYVVPQNTLMVFVGARVLGGDDLAMSELGGTSPTGSAEWSSLVRTRGQLGAPTTDFGPWGGSIAFNSSAASHWYFDSDIASVADLPPADEDFYSVALHELGHLLGVGVAGSWFLQANGNFTGPHSMRAYGGPVPLDSNGIHWAEGTVSHALGTGLAQEAALDPTLDPGERKFLTELDLAGLRDVGWQAVPEPSTTSLALIGMTIAWSLRRKWRRT